MTASEFNDNHYYHTTFPWILAQKNVLHFEKVVIWIASVILGLKNMLSDRRMPKLVLLTVD